MNISRSRAYRAAVIAGGTALLGAMAVDFFAVIGRHTGLPLLGSIELVQLLIGIAGTMALVVATLHDSHAVVRLVLANVGAGTAALMQRCNRFGAAVFFLLLAAGSAWITLDLWHAHEETELWLLPLRPLRVLIVLALLTTSFLFLRKLWAGEAR